MAITYQSSHPQYYKRLSEYQISSECCFTSDGEFDLIKMKAIMMQQANCCDHDQGFSLPKGATVKTVKYPGFSVIALGVPHNIWLPDLTSFELMRRDLRNNGHILVCWDSKSIAFVTDKTSWVPVFEEFLTNQTFHNYIKGAGLFVSL